jgi:hypothetical protein
MSMVILAAGVALAAVVVPALPQAEAQADWPPRPETPTPTLPAPPGPAQPSEHEGGWLQLRVEFDAQWPWERIHWQALWTVVQWQDPQGVWHDVEGWQGTLDRVVVEGEETVIGRKDWWVQERDAGRGPFCWLVYRGEGDVLLAQSEKFYLPQRDQTATVVEVSVGP